MEMDVTGEMTAVGISIKTDVRMAEVVVLITDVHIAVSGGMDTSTVGKGSEKRVTETLALVARKQKIIQTVVGTVPIETTAQIKTNKNNK